MRRLKTLFVISLIGLLVDAGSYILEVPENNLYINHWFLHIMNMLTYVMSNVVLIGFANYCDAYIREKTPLNKWVFRIPTLIMLGNVIVDVVYYLQGHLVVYKDGRFVQVGTVPVFVLVSYLALLFYTPVVAFIKRKDVGMKAVVLTTAYAIPIIVSIAVIELTGNDYSVVAGSISIFFVSTLLQKELTQSRIETDAAHQALEKNYMRMLALEDKFECLYDVDLENNTYEMYIKGQTTGDVNARLINENTFFEDLKKNIGVFYPEDRTGVLNVLTPDYIRKALSENSSFDWYYRLIVAGKPVWVKMRVLYKDAQKRNVIVGVFNAEEEMAAKLLEEQQRNELINRMVSDDAVFLIDYVKDTRKTIHNRLYMAERYSDDEKQSVAFSRYVNSFVAKADRALLLKITTPDYMRERLKDEDEYKVEYRDVSAGIQRFCEMRIAKYSDTEVLQSFRENDKEVANRLIFKKLEEDYFALFAVDLESGHVEIMKNDPGRFAEVGIVTKYAPMMKQLSESFEGETRAFMETIGNIDYLKKRFETEDKATYTYKSHLNDGNQWGNVTELVILRNDDDTPSLFALGFSLLDADANERQELQKKVKEQNQRLEAQQKQLKEAVDNADAANHAKTSFLFNMSHDIRTPMNAITGFTNMAIKHIDDKGKALDCLAKIQKSGSMLLSLINSVLEVSRIESGKAILEEQPGDVLYSFVNIESTLHELAETKDIKLTFEFGEIQDRFVYCDFSRCMRIFVNIISNAIKYTREGGYVKVLCEQVAPAQDGYARYRYTIADNGIGMSEEFQKHVFEQFTRERTATVSGIQGTGLGLAVCKSFVDLMKGTIEYQSKQGEGTTFYITLPFKLQQGREYTDPVSGEIIKSGNEIEQKNEIDFVGKTVLLVEDNELNREIAYEILGEAGFVVEEAEDGAQAVQLLKDKGPDYYDFILMDIQMPVLNGYDATKAIRAMYPNAKLPIIALSANAFAEDKAASLAAGMNDHVAKPIRLKELFNTLGKFL